MRKLRRGGKLGQATEHERSRGVRVSMRQASDRGRHSSNEPDVPHGDS